MSDDSFERQVQAHHDSAGFLEVFKVDVSAWQPHYQLDGYYVRRTCPCHYHQRVSVRFETQEQAERCLAALDDDCRRTLSSRRRGRGAMTTRIGLPDRRNQITERIAWALEDGKMETKVFVSAGFDPETIELREVFLRGGGKIGSERDFLLDDIAVLFSRALQCGDTARVIAAGMGRKPDGSPTSILGAAADAVVRIEAAVCGNAELARPRGENIIDLTAKQ